MNFADWGVIDYLDAWKQQEAIFNTMIEQKRNGLSPHPSETIVFCEHPHVYTLGRSGNKQNLLVSEESLKNSQVSFYHIDRGGDITYHGPGQIVVYPIIDLEHHQLSLKSYIYKMEEAIIKTVEEFGVKASRLDGATGVWVDANNDTARKICAIGVKASRFVTMHGFALNVNTDLTFFTKINPCGFTTKGVTSLEKESGNKIEIKNVKKALRENLYDTLFHS